MISSQENLLFFQTCHRTDIIRFHIMGNFPKAIYPQLLIKMKCFVQLFNEWMRIVQNYIITMYTWGDCLLRSGDIKYSMENISCTPWKLLLFENFKLLFYKIPFLTRIVRP